MSSFSIGSQYIQIIVSLSKRSPQGFVDKVVTPLLNLNFSNYGQRDRSEKEITNNIRQRIASLTGIQRFSVKKASGGPSGSDIIIGVVGPESKELTKYAKEIHRFLFYRRNKGCRA